MNKLSQLIQNMTKLKLVLYFLTFIMSITVPVLGDSDYHFSLLGLGIQSWSVAWLILVPIEMMFFCQLRIGYLAEIVFSIVNMIILVLTLSLADVPFYWGSYLLLIMYVALLGINIYLASKIRKEHYIGMVKGEIKDGTTQEVIAKKIILKKDAIYYAPGVFVWKPLKLLLNKEELVGIESDSTNSNYTLKGRDNSYCVHFSQREMGDGFKVLLSKAQLIAQQETATSHTTTSHTTTSDTTTTNSNNLDSTIGEEWRKSASVVAIGIAMLFLQPVVDAFKPSIFDTILKQGMDYFLYNNINTGAMGEYVGLNMLSILLIFGPIIYLVGLYKFKKVQQTESEKDSIGTIITSVWFCFFGGLIAFIPLIGIIGKFIVFIGVIINYRGYSKWYKVNTMPLSTSEHINVLKVAAIIQLWTYLLFFLPYIPAFFGFLSIVGALYGWIKVRGANLNQLQLVEVSNDSVQAEEESTTTKVDPRLSEIEMYSDEKLDDIIHNSEIYDATFVELATLEQALRKKAEVFHDDATKLTTDELKEIVDDSDVYSDEWKCACRKELTARQNK